MLNLRSSRANALIEEPVPGRVSSPCQVVVDHHVGAMVLHLQGDLDVSTADEFRSLLTVAKRDAVVLDLTEASLIDEDGLRVLRDVIRGIHEHGGLVAISRPWRLAEVVSGLVGTDGLVFLAISTAGAISWLCDPSNRPQNHLEEIRSCAALRVLSGKNTF